MGRAAIKTAFSSITTLNHHIKTRCTFCDSFDIPIRSLSTAHIFIPNLGQQQPTTETEGGTEIQPWKLLYARPVCLDDNNNFAKCMTPFISRERSRCTSILQADQKIHNVFSKYYSHMYTRAQSCSL